MLKKASILCAIAFSALLAFAQDVQGGLIEGDSYGFLASPPKGWVWDSRALRHQGIRGLYYKEGSSFSPSKLHIYINPVQKSGSSPATLEAFIVADEKRYMKSNPGNEVVDLDSYTPGLDYTFILKDFDDKGRGYYQSIAYYEGEDAYLVFVLFCRSARERDSERASFLELLDSFTYIHKE